MGSSISPETPIGISGQGERVPVTQPHVNPSRVRRGFLQALGIGAGAATAAATPLGKTAIALAEGLSGGDDPYQIPEGEQTADETVARIRWNESDPNKAQLFEFGKIPGAQKQFGIDFNQPVPEDFVNPKTNMPFKDKNGKDIHPENLGQALKLLMDEYQVPEFIAIGKDVSEMPPTEPDGSPHGYFLIEDPGVPKDFYYPGSDAGFSPLIYDEWWIKPKDHPNAVVFTYYLQDSALPVAPQRQYLFHGYFARQLGDTLYYYQSSTPDTYYKPSTLDNTTERSILAGTLKTKLKPVALSPT